MSASVSSARASSIPSAPWASRASSHRLRGKQHGRARAGARTRTTRAPPPASPRPPRARRSSSRVACSSSPPRSTIRGIQAARSTALSIRTSVGQERVQVGGLARRASSAVVLRARRRRIEPLHRLRRLVEALAVGVGARRLQEGVGVVALGAAPPPARAAPRRAGRRSSCGRPSARPRPGRSSGPPARRSGAGAGRGPAVSAVPQVATASSTPASSARATSR